MIYFIFHALCGRLASQLLFDDIKKNYPPLMRKMLVEDLIFCFVWGYGFGPIALFICIFG
jgi:hypothetical protein